MKKISWTENQTPKSNEFGDIYYNEESGIKEKKYVFVDGNNLENKFKTLNNDFNILELGFGTGLSFLVTAIAFAKSKTKYKLNFTSTELYPLNFAKIEHAFKVWPEFYSDSFVQKFLLEYKKADLTSDILINIDNITLQILIGDANIKLKNIQQTQQCFFLDGFTPKKNESMWSEELFNEVKRLSDAKSTASTYSACRIVKNRLEQAGFKYSKLKGFGSKRNMLIGIKK